MLSGQMAPLKLTSVKDGPRIIPLNFGQKSKYFQTDHFRLKSCLVIVNVLRRILNEGLVPTLYILNTGTVRPFIS